MTVRSIPFDQLPFSRLFRDYIRQEKSLRSFFIDFPLKDDAVRTRADEFRFAGDRNAAAEAIETFNRHYDAPEESLLQASRLRDSKALAVVTGQQLVLYGGPLFTVYKTLTAILYARRWERLLDRPVVPVFWLADEDHDFLEATQLGFLCNEQWMSLEYENGTSGIPVGRERFGSRIGEFSDRLFGSLCESDFTADLRKLFARHYKKGNSFRDAFAGLLLELFGRYGLVLAGSDDERFKSLIAGPMAKAAGESETLFESLERQSVELESVGYERQAFVQPSNLFHIDAQQVRRKLELDQGRWNSSNGHAWSSEELEREILRSPADLSPNVFLRPIMQDRLLPTLAYVCGPGELAYYAQMKRAYEWAGQQMPMLLPRLSMTLVEPAIGRISDELPFEFHEYASRKEDLETLWLQRCARHNLDELFGEWLKENDRLVEMKKREIAQIDPTLEATAARAGAIYAKEVERLRKKAVRSIKRREQIQLDRLHRVREHLFPGGRLQERQVAFVYFMNRYGPDIWDRLLEALRNEKPDSHKVISL